MFDLGRLCSSIWRKITYSFDLRGISLGQRESSGLNKEAKHEKRQGFFFFFFLFWQNKVDI